MKVKKPNKAVILVGGEGTRLRPLTHTTTKAMVPVLNRPFIEYLIRHLHSHDVTEIIFAVCYKPDSIRNYLEKKGGLASKIIYSIEQTPLGTAGAVKNAISNINEGEPLFVLNGDIFTDLDLTNMFNFHKAKEAKATIALTPVDDPTQFGVVELDSQQRVTRFIEKPRRQEVTSNLINAGIYIVESNILECVPNGKRCMFEHDIFPKLIAEGEPIYGYHSRAYWIDMGTPDKYLRLNRDLLSKKYYVPYGTLQNSLADESQAYSHVKFTGPVLIDKGCTIGKDVQIKGPSVIGLECSIGNNTVIEDSILWEKVQVGDQAIIKNCIIASNVHIADNSQVQDAVIGQDPASNQVIMIKTEAK